MNLEQMGEFGLISRIARNIHSPEGVLGIGDDCAVIPQKSGVDTLVSTDMLIEGTHFLMDDISSERLGWKSAAVNLSDIAAMGGRPSAAFLAFALSPEVDSLWVDGFMNGFTACCDRCGATLLGGDTVASKSALSVCVTVLGECPSSTALLRSGARIGDLVCVTGTLGDSAGGLKAILEKLPRGGDVDRLTERHYHPVPRVEEGVMLRNSQAVHAMMDISDGLASDLPHILEKSLVSASIDLRSLPLSPELQRVWTDQATHLAVCGGEDYELLFTVSPQCERLLEVPHTVIGEITSSPSGETDWRGAKKNFQPFRQF